MIVARVMANPLRVNDDFRIFATLGPTWDGS